ncbi:hypothetical protein CVT26_015252, partial [Gymnopilus dilepis]
MSGLKNSPFGKRLRASRQERDDEDGLSPRKPRVNPIFGSGTASSSSTPALDSRPTTSDSSGPESPVEFHGTSSALSMPRIAKDYGDRFVPSKDSGDLRTSYHLLEEGGPCTPSKNRIIPTESDALKEQANAIFNSILHTEVTPPSPRRPISPTRPAASSS